MTSPSPAIVFGHPEFAKEVQTAFPRLFEVLPRLTATLNDLTVRGHKDPEPVQRVILNLALLSGVSMLELMTLAGNGMGQGAMKIVGRPVSLEAVSSSTKIRTLSGTKTRIRSKRCIETALSYSLFPRRDWNFEGRLVELTLALVAP
jgi:hypothetical protein